MDEMDGGKGNKSYRDPEQFLGYIFVADQFSLLDVAFVIVMGNGEKTQFIEVDG